MKPAVFLFPLALSACAVIDPVTVARLASTSPLTADPAVFELRANLPDGLALAPGAAVLTLSATRGEEVADGRFTLAQVRDGDATVLRVAEVDVPVLRALQSRINAWEEADPDGTMGSLGIDVQPCTTGNGPAPQARFSVDLVMAPGGPARPLLRPVPVRRFKERLRKEAGVGLMPCPPQARD
ncbi:MAG: hypothetical protein QNJ09_12360 [Paracoccaceae bacterium]|nr:hypothetical protein [Paracoccaceae bacterium]